MKKTIKKAAETNRTAGRKKAATPAKKAKKTAAPKTMPARSNDGYAAKRGSKGATILALIQRNGGATTAELQQATGWQPHSVRGFLSGVIGKKMGLKLASARREDGQRVYSLEA
jgi:hypothetical protein